jgi:hypothetical protein
MLPAHLVPNLAKAADSAIINVLSHGGARASKPSGEVSAVRALILDGFDEIAAAWSPALKAYGLRISLRAVFCHSRPHVTFPQVPHPKYGKPPAVRRCELADLLIVVDHIDPTKKIDDRRVVLVQAKILKGGSLVLSGSEWIQHELLGWLPPFNFIDPAYHPRSRNLKRTPTIGSPGYTAEYGGIDLNTSPPAWHQWLTATTTPWFTSAAPLATYLAGMVTGITCYGRDAVRNGPDDWSFTVDELLRVTAARPITRKSGVLRGNDNVARFIADTSPQVISYVGGGDGYIEGDVPGWPEGPLSTVHMVIRSIEDPSED